MGYRMKVRSLLEIRSMPIPAGNPFRKVVCQQCGWQEVSYQPGDVMLMPTDCPKCEAKLSVATKAGALESMLCAPVKFVNHQLKIINRR